MADKDLSKKINDLIRIVEKLSVPIPPIPAIPAIPAIPHIYPSGDHDTIVKLVEAVENIDTKFTEKFIDLTNAIKSLNDGTSSKLNDHELKITKLETSVVEIRLEQVKTKTQMATWGVVAGLTLTITQFVIGKLWN